MYYNDSGDYENYYIFRPLYKCLKLHSSNQVYGNHQV